MKFREITLQRFGPFADAQLDFSEEPQRLHVIFGPNEAGKSTTLRAVRGFLFGIEDADVRGHDPKALRVRATLEAADGASLTAVRRKGRKDTLRAADDAPLDEAQLTRMLGGVSRELFDTMFGITQEALRNGGRELAAGRGDVGESLFAAGLGQTALRPLREELKARSEELFLANVRAKQPLVNRAIRAFGDAVDRRKRASLRPADFHKKRADADEKRNACEAAEAELKAARSRLARLRKVKAALVPLARKDALAAERAALGDVVRLDPRVTEERARAERELDAAGPREAKLAEAIAEREARLAALDVEARVLEHEARIEALNRRLGAHEKARDDLRVLVRERDRLAEEAQNALRRLGGARTVDEAYAACPIAPVEARVRQLAEERPKLDAAAAAAGAQVLAAEQGLARARTRRDGAPPPRDVGALRLALEEAATASDVDERLRAAERSVAELEAEARAKRLALAPYEHVLDDERFVPPALGTLDALETTLRAAERRERDLDEARTKGRLVCATVDAQLSELIGAQAVPSEDDLLAVRAERDAAWSALTAAWEDASAKLRTGDLFAQPALEAARACALAFDKAIRDADRVADRLRSDASRVERRAQLSEQLRAARAEVAELETAIEQARAARADAAEAFRAFFLPHGIDPSTPAEMKAWLERFAVARASADRAAQARDTRDALLRLSDALREGLVNALGRTGRFVSAGIDRAERASTSSVRALAELARGLVDEEARRDAERRNLEAECEACADLLEQRKRAEMAVAATLDAWRMQWAEAVRPLGLDGAASPDVARGVLDAFRELGIRVDELRKTEKRVLGIERDARAFASEARALFRLVDAACEGGVGTVQVLGAGCDDDTKALDGAANAGDTESPDVLARELAQRLRVAQDKRAVRETLEREIRAARDELESTREQRAVAEATLARWMEAARVADRAALRDAERASLTAQRIDEELESLRRRLFEVADGSAQDELVEEARATDADAVAAAIAALEARIEGELEARVRKLREEAALLEAELQRLDGSGEASLSAEDAEQALAELREHLAAFVRVRLASTLLGREVERYRREHQGPVLTRASSIFSELTLGGFCALRADLDERDRPVLECVRASGEALGVESLSEGARDQLFLALRIASIEAHVAASTPLPVLVDDVLVTFDDQRAEAALRVLAKLAARTQVLLFTHHERVVELARDVARAHAAEGTSGAPQPPALLVHDLRRLRAA